MPKIALDQGAYQARSPIANAQVCYNLYCEQNTKDAPFPITHYPAPGLKVLSDFSAFMDGTCRCIYQASDGTVYCAMGGHILRWLGTGSTASNYILVGQLPSDTGYPVYMCDNGTTLVIVDSSNLGWMTPLPGTLNSLVQITDSAFYGSNRVDFIDTFLVFNKAMTNEFYTTTSNVVTPFDPLYFASKAGWNDRLVCCACLHDNIWLFGNQTTEIWYNAGAAAFPFARMPNSILQQGCISAFSVVVTDNAVYWLSQDRYGRNMLMRGEGYGAKRVSTFAVEYEWSTYTTLADCVGMSFQVGGHEFVGLYFAEGNAWWCYDVTTQFWHKRTYGDLSTPWLVYCAYGLGDVSFVTAPQNAILAGDRTGPRILEVNLAYFTDDGTPIIRQRSWSHLQGDDGQRVAHTRFSASFTGISLSNSADDLAPDTLTLDWSDDAGFTYGTPVNQTVNGQSNGQYQWRRLGYARDRVYRLTWSGVGDFALNGAYVDVTPHGT